MNYKTRIGIFGLALMIIGCSEPQPHGKILGDVANGGEVFKANCAVCHQQDGKGKPGMAPSINNIDFLAVANDHMIKRFVLEGRQGTTMIPFKNNPNVADNIDDLVAYMRSWTEDYPLYKEVALDHSWESDGNAAKGKVLFANYCAACHGSEGQGYSAGGSGTGIANAAFASMVPDDYIKQTLMLGRAGTAMKPFIGAKGVANLTDAEIDDIVAFLRTNGTYVELTSAMATSAVPSADLMTILIANPLLALMLGICIIALLALLYAVFVMLRLVRVIHNKE